MHTFSTFAATLPPYRRLLGLDMGDKKIGIALSDTSRCIATPHSVLKRQSFEKDINAILALVKEFQIAGLVFGWPVDRNGEEGENCAKVRTFTEKLLKKQDIPIFFQDERMSTAAANRALKEGNVKRHERHQIDDKIAASIILQTVLDGMGYV